MVCESMKLGSFIKLLQAAAAFIVIMSLTGCANRGSNAGNAVNMAVNWEQPLVTATPPTATPPTAANDALPPPSPREFRAAWVATVANIDWPSKPNLTVAQQQAEIIQIVERAKALNLNALVLQVRTSADALYPSDIEPWSEYLTGEQGRAPVPFYDPLKLWIEESHKRGIELHAWFNPYRARHTQAKSPLAASHIANKIPSAVKSYGGYLWMDPGEVQASNQTLSVILDVVRRYDIDGVHIDDYFYPYPVAVPGTVVPPTSPDDTPSPVAELPFPDDASWQAYLAKGGKLVRDDWRRQNVNSLIEKIYQGIHREKNWVKFGISPFGLPKPSQRPPNISGFSQYDKLFADAELWLQNGWLDYFTPQLYWPINQTAQAYGTLLDYWVSQNKASRHIWPGLYTSRINASEKSWQPEEILNQIALTRSTGQANGLVRGHVHFSMVALTENRRNISEQLKVIAYNSAALVPRSPWLGQTLPAMPQVTADLIKGTRANIKLKLSPVRATSSKINGELASRVVPPARYAVWQRYGNEWRFSVLAADNEGDAEMDFYIGAPSGGLNRLVVSAVDRFGNESAPMFVTPSNELKK